MTDELKPCHCKRKPCIHRACLNNETYQRFAVVCSCGMNTDYWESEKDAVEKWNTRPIEDALVKAMEVAQENIAALIPEVAGTHRAKEYIAWLQEIDAAIALAKGGTHGSNL